MSTRLQISREKAASLFQDAHLLLSPMAGVTDMVFRAICREHGADLCYCEFVSAEGILHGNQSSRDLMELAPGESPVGIQLFGSDPAHLAQAARDAEALNPDLIDLNFGCPVKKIVKKNGGSALLADLPLMQDIVEAVVNAVQLPVTAKIRLGWDEDSLNYMEVSSMLEQAGICAITVHGRSRAQRYTGTADWAPIAEIKAAAKVPVIGNGDVRSGEDYLRIRRETGCDAVMIARAAIGNPFIFEQCRAAHEGREYEFPMVGRVIEVLLDHARREVALKGPRTGLNRMKRHFSHCMKGHPGVAELRKRVFQHSELAPIEELYEEYRQDHSGERIG